MVLLVDKFGQRRVSAACLAMVAMASFSNASEPIRVLSLGDSYTIGESVTERERWPNQLAEALRHSGAQVAPPKIVARTGWTTDELATAIQNMKLDENYDLVTLSIGVNNQYRGRSVEEYRTQLQSLIETATRHAQGTPERVLLVNIPDWGVTRFAANRDGKKIAQEIEAFNAVMKDEAAKAHVAYVDILDISRKASEDMDSWLAKDGLHPSGKMYAGWVERILPIAQERLKLKR